MQFSSNRGASSTLQSKSRSLTSPSWLSFVVDRLLSGKRIISSLASKPSQLMFLSQRRKLTRITRRNIFRANLGANIEMLEGRAMMAIDSITSIGTPFTENFDAMAASATATIPSAIKAGTDYSTGTTATTLAYGTSGIGAVTSASSGGVINWANGVTATSTDRSLGILNTGSFTSPRSFIAAVTNNSGSTITSLTINWDFEKSRSGTRAFDWTFFHGSTTTATTAATSGDQSYAADAANTVISNPPLTTAKSVSLTGLTVANSSTYYLRWTFTGVGGSSNGQGIGIDNISITAASAAAASPTVTTPTSANLAPTSATLGGNLTSNNGSAITARGVVYALTATNSSPQIGGTGVTALPEGGTATGVFTTPVTGLTQSSAYSFVAYATNGVGTSYSSVGTFSTTALTVPVVTTPTSASVTQTAATLGGNVTGDGGAVVTVRGIVYAPTSTNSNPQLLGTGVIDVPVSGTTGVFTTPVSSLVALTGYSFAAYATNSQGTTYSSVATFTTAAAPVEPTVTSPTSASITATGATLGGNVSSDGGSAITARGVAYALTSVNASPIIGGTGVTNVPATGTTGVFTATAITGLTTGAGYSFVAYATNAQGTSYSSIATFSTLSAPTVATPTTSIVADVIATLNGNVLTDGGSTITSRGFVYSVTSVNSNPQISGTGVTNTVVTPAATGTYSRTIANLSPNTAYSFASYAINANGTTYSTVGTFTTAVTTALAAGDLVFTGYNGTTTTERTSFVALKAIAAGTTISITDNGYDGGTSLFLVSEGTSTLYFSQAFTAGSRFYFETGAAGGFFNFDGTQTGLLTVVASGSVALSNSGDQVTLFQGTLTTPSAFLTQVSSGPFVTVTPNTNTTYLAPGLTAGTNAVTLGAVGNNGVLNSADPDIGTSVTGTPAAIRSVIQDVGNWTPGTLTTYVVPPAITFTVTTQASPTITVTAPSAIYTGLAYAGASSSVSNGGSPAPVVGFTYYVGTGTGGTNLGAAAPINVGTYTVVGSSPANPGNNAATSDPVTFSITPASLLVMAGNASKVYGTVFSGTGFTTGTLVNGETVGSVTLTSAGSPATASVTGSAYMITPSAATGGTFTPSNYNISYGVGFLSVTPAPLTITASDATKVYGTTASLTGFSTGTLFNSDTVSGVTLASPGSAATASVAGSPYAITASAATGTGLVNYAISYLPGSLTVTAAPLSVTAEAKSKFVGDADPAFTYTTSAFVNSETAAIALSGSLNRVTGETAGTYAVTQGSLLAVDGNYAITYVSADLTINPVPVAPTFNSATVNGTDLFLSSTQRSQLTSLVLNFSAPVIVAPNAFTISNIGLFTAQSPAALGASQIIVSGSGTLQITLRWGAGPGVIARSGTGSRGNSLADGNWQLSIDPTKVTAAAGGLSLTGGTDFGAVPTDNFFRLYGDSNGDGIVNGTDSGAMRAALAAPTSNAAFDWDGNGTTTAGVDTSNSLNNFYNKTNNKLRRTNFGLPS